MTISNSLPCIESTMWNLIAWMSLSFQKSVWLAFPNACLIKAESQIKALFQSSYLMYLISLNFARMVFQISRVPARTTNNTILSVPLGRVWNISAINSNVFSTSCAMTEGVSRSSNQVQPSSLWFPNRTSSFTAMFLRLLPRPRNERTLPRSGNSHARAQPGAPRSF